MKYFFLLLFLCSLNAEEYFYLNGHLSKEALQPIQNRIVQLKENPPKEIGIAIQSSSGDLEAIFDLAEQLYALKPQAKISVFIDERVMGPAAIMPFISDQLEGSSFFSWGDIPLSAEKSYSTNLLQNRVLSLIDPVLPNKELWERLAQGMSDPNAIVQQGLSVPGQTLVLNQNQVRQLKLLHATTTLAAFENRFKGETFKTAVVKVLSDEKLKAHIKPQEGINRIGRIHINDRNSTISQATWIYVKNALDYYKKQPPLFILLELNTPGGEVFAAEKIADALKEMDTQHNIPVVAFINNWAISAGALIAYSSRFIAISKDASMGAAEPLLQDASGDVKVASEKVNSAFRTDFANRAKFFDRNPYLAEAMVDKDTIVVFRHGNILKLDDESQIRKSGPDADILISPKGKLLTLSAEQMITYRVADLLVPPAKLEEITAQEKERGEWPAKKEALFQYPFFNSIPQATVDEYQMDWKTWFLVLLANPVVSSALFLGLMLGFYLEMNTPGFGIAGTIALTSLGLIILSSFALEIADWLEVILLLSGLAIILVDLFVLPTFGLLGIIGLVAFLAGLLGLMLPGLGSIEFEFDTQTFNAAGEAFLNRLGWLLGTFVIGLIAIALLARYVAPSMGAFKKFVLEGKEQVGYLAGIDPKQLPQVGQTGVVISTLRPAGKVEIDQRIYDAMSTGRFIEKEAKVVVKRLEGSTLMVDEVI